jgi:hypothetical protein
MTKKFVGLIVLIAISGCATTYQYDGKKYDTKEKMHQAVESSNAEVLSSITRLPTPLTQKKLVFAIPSETTAFNEQVRRHVALNASQPDTAHNEIYENLSKSGYKSMKVFFDAVQKRNIYATTQLINMESMTGSFAASADTDTLYWVAPSQGSDQWYYTSLKHGKQIFAYDRSKPTPAGKVQAFIDAVQVQAVRD